MSSLSAKFLAIASGPSRLRSELRRQNKAMRKILRAGKAMQGVGSTVPQSVLGGDIFLFMSERLRQMLQDPERAKGLKEIMAGPIQRFSADPPGGVLSRHWFSLNPGPCGEAGGRFSSGNAQGQRGNQPFGPSGLSNFSKEEERLGSRPAPPLLVEKLRQYWQFNQQRPTPEKTPGHLPGGEKEGNGNPPSFTASPPNALTGRSWPELTGEQLSRKLQAFTSGRGGPASSKVGRQVIQSNLGEKVEIQNVFHMEVKSKDREATDSTADLAERVADILREQAWQHGIDIT